MNYLMATHDNGLGAIIALKETLPESVIISGDPDRLLGIVGLEHILTLHLQGDDQVRRWIWVRLAGLSKLDMARHVGIWFFSDVNTISEKEKEIIYIEIYRIELKIEW